MSGKAQIRIGLYMPRELMQIIDRRLPTDALSETHSRSEWIREACRQRLQAEALAVLEKGGAA